MSDNFEKVKQGVPIGRVIESYRGQITRGFVNPSLCCDHNDCFSVNEDDNVFKCHSCGKGGSIIDMVMAIELCDKVEAMKRCAEIGGIELEESGSGRSVKEKEKPESGQEKAFRLAMEYYIDIRKTAGRKAAEKWFLQERGHTVETMDALAMGWTDGQLVKHLREAHKFTTAELVNYSLAVDRDKEGVELQEPRDFFWKADMAVFPIVDHSGQVVNLTVKDPAKEFKGQQLKNVKKLHLGNHASLGRSEKQIIIEGQNDKSSLFDIGIKHVADTCGAPSLDQVKKIKNHCAGKVIYLWFDKDPKMDPRKSNGGPAHTRFIVKNLMESNVDVKIIVHPGEAKDPDDFIQGLIKAEGHAKARQSVIKLMEAAVDPLEWEISQIALIDGAKDSLAIAKERDILREINQVKFLADREIYIDQLAKAIPTTVKAIEELIESAQELYKELGSRFRGSIKKAEAIEIADFIYKWFSGNGGRFFKTMEDKKSWLFYHGKTYEIGNNNDFNALIFRMARLGRCESPGTQVWYYLETQCADQGEPVEMMSWVYTDRKNDSLYYNLNSPHQKIIRVSAGGEPVIIDNGTNENSVLLSSSPQIREFVYQPNTGEAEGFTALKSLLMDTTPAEPHQRYFLACWVISVFMINFQSDRGLMQVIGQSGVGKSKVSERVSQLVYGDNFIGSGTGAADARIATKNPIVFLDNIENRDLVKGKVDFLLLLANSARKPKAASGSDTEVVYQKLDSMGMITAIEPFPGRLPELINRTFPLILEKRFCQTGYHHGETMREILKKRPLMISAILKIIGTKVLPKLSERSYWSNYINSTHPGHNKERNNEHFCTMMLILEALLEYIPAMPDKPARQQATILLDMWITYHDEQASQTEINSNTLLTYLDALQKEVCISIRKKDGIRFEEHNDFDKKVIIYEDPEYHETFYLTEPEEPEDAELAFEWGQTQQLGMIISSAELCTLLDRFCRNIGKKSYFDNPTALGARIANDRKVLRKGGWDLIESLNEKIRPRYKKVKGTYSWFMVKTIKAIRFNKDD